MQRYLFYIDDSIYVIHRHHDHLDLVLQCDAKKQESALFARYLAQSLKLPMHIIVDSVDEEFTRVAIPHINARDRSRLIERKAERFFRQRKSYHYHQILGREKEGKRHDQVLIAGLTQSDFLDQLLILLSVHQIPVAAIWSQAVLSVSLAKGLHLSDEFQLIVSQQTQSHIRLSFLANKKLHTSRLVLLRGEDFNSQVLAQVRQTTIFLTNSGYLGFNQKLKVVIIVDESLKAGLQALSVSWSEHNAMLQTQVLSNTEVAKKLKVKPHNCPYSLAIFAQLAAKQHSFKDHYRREKEKRDFYDFLARKSLVYAGMFGLLSSILISLYLFAQGLEIGIQNKQLMTQQRAIERNYDKRYRPIEEQLKQAKFKREAVLMAYGINDYKHNNPLQAFIDVSRAYSASQLEGLSLKYIGWKFSQEDKKDNSNGVTGGTRAGTRASMGPGVSSNRQGRLPPTRSQLSRRQGQASDNNIQPIMQLKGIVPLWDNQFRQADEQLKILQTALLKLDLVKAIEVKKYPIELRSEHSLNLDNNLIKPDDERLLGFELAIKLKNTTQDLKEGELLARYLLKNPPTKELGYVGLNTDAAVKTSIIESQP